MYTVLRANVRARLTIAILITIIVSWILGTGIANYFNYLSIKSLRQEMLAHPKEFPWAVDEPKFGVIDFIVGRPPVPRRHREETANRSGADVKANAADTSVKNAKPNDAGPDDERNWNKVRRLFPPPRRAELRSALLRLCIALFAAILTGSLLARKFTGPLRQLSKGAAAFQSGRFGYRIPVGAPDEFSAVADAMNQMAGQVANHIAALEDDAERRRRFLADIAHELRSPVTTMRTMAGALKDGVANEPQRRDRAVSALVETSERLLRLVRDLLVLARLDLKELPLAMQEVDLRRLAASVIQSYEPEASIAGVKLLAVEPGPEIRAAVDPDRVIQVLDNAVGNAVSYAGAGAEVEIRLQDGDPVVISVRDNGKGIEPQDLPYIFDSFYRADAARTPGDHHSGLGLSISKKLVEAHGGSLNVESESGKGTTVTITLPASTTSAPEATAEPGRV